MKNSFRIAMSDKRYTEEEQICW